MAAATAQSLRRSIGSVAWLSFFAQALIAVSFELADDLARGHFAQHGTAQGIHDARRLVSFEMQHHFFVEPAWQLFFLHTRHLWDITISWLDVAHVMDGIYIGGHVGVTLTVALWVFITHRRWFPLLRNMVILTNGFSLLIYENFPVAPPRLTTGLHWDGKPFQFQDTVFGVLNRSGHIIGSQSGFNEFSAMPSVHIGWALIVGSALVILARTPWARIFGAIYPGLMLIAVVVTGNHYLLDAAGAVGVVLCATIVAAIWERYYRLIPWPWSRTESEPAIRPT